MNRAPKRRINLLLPADKKPQALMTDLQWHTIRS